MAIIACKLQKFSALEHMLKLKSMLNVSSNKIWKQILQQWNDIESLFPDVKAQILVENATEQQKYQQSLSPEYKAQILSKNTDAHRKQRKSLSPEKNIKILETNAAAHKKERESLSPD